MLSFTFLDLLGFICYTPTLFGPIINFPQYYEQVTESKPLLTFNGNLKQPLLKLLKMILKVAIWLFIVLVSTEIFFIHFLNLSTTLVTQLSGFGAVGYGNGYYLETNLIFNCFFFLCSFIQVFCMVNSFKRNTCSSMDCLPFLPTLMEVSHYFHCQFSSAVSICIHKCGNTSIPACMIL